MANLIYANSNQNYFQFHGSTYKYQKGVPLGLPISRSLFKNFLQNLECKFIKSSSKSKALIHYPIGCPKRHCTLDLFISSYPHFMDLADHVGAPHGPHTALCIIISSVTSSMEFKVFKRCRYQ